LDEGETIKRTQIYYYWEKEEREKNAKTSKPYSSEIRRDYRRETQENNVQKRPKQMLPIK